MLFELFPAYIAIISAVIISFGIVYVVIPTIVTVANMKGLTAEPNQRTAHKHSIPTLGGVAIFAGFSLSLILCINTVQLPNMQFLLGSVLIVFFIGLKDDILIIAPVTKLSGQLLAALIIILPGQNQLTHFHGFFQIYEIPFWISIPLSILIILTITNGFNLIDGIDGLASGIGIVTSGTLGLWFFFTGNYGYAVVGASLAGGLAAFFIYNVFGKQNKIFMGDTGALLVGLIVSVLIIQFNEANIITDYTHMSKYSTTAAPSVSFAILVIPIFDTFRVMFVRFVLKKPLFTADRRHIHHRLLDLDLSHKKASLLLILINIFFIAFAFYFRNVSIRRLLLIEILIAMVFSYIPTMLLEHRKNKKQKQKYLQEFMSKKRGPKK